MKKQQVLTKVKGGILTAFLCLISLAVSAQTKSITGTVTSKDKEPLIGAAVKIAGTSLGTKTDANGFFKLSNVSNKTKLNVSYVGMVSKTVSVGSKTVLNIVLDENSEMLDQVVVVGFGRQKKENLTGAVATIDTKMLESRPVNNVTQALQGAVAGMNFSVGAGGGQLDNSLNFNIRGAGTIGAGSKAAPLVLIDGVEGDLNSLNPSDVKSISVLKDAASSSIYGSRAAFGVVLVTTKSGREGDIVVNYSSNYRVSSPVLQLATMDAEDFVYYFNDAARNSGGSPVFSKEVVENVIKYKKGELDYATEWNSNAKKWKNWTQSWDNVNWYDEFYRKNVPAVENNISVRGGSKKLNYFFSTNWLNQSGLMRHNTEKRDRYTLNSRISSQILPYLKLTYGGRFSRVDFSKPKYLNNMFYHNVGRKWPTVALKDKNGHYVLENSIPFLNAGRTKTQRDVFTQQLELIFNPIEAWTTHIQLNYKTVTDFGKSVGLSVYTYDDKGVAIPTKTFGAGTQSVGNWASKSNFFSPNIYTEYVASINNNHNFKVMTGFQTELYKYQGFGADRQFLFTPRIQVINGTYGEDDNVRGDEQHWATAGFFGRLNYDYKGIYLLELNGRYDGTSRFLSNKRWNFFPSASLGYNISKENFFKDFGKKTKINHLKFRGSYGVLGNQNTTNWYPFYPKMKLGVANGNWLINGEKTNTASNPDLVSALLSWDVFKRTTYDMVGPAPTLPSVLGISPARVNNTDMESKGFELEISWRDYIGEDFSYGIKGTLTDSRQFITKYPNEVGELNKYYKGRELGEIWGYTSAGIAKTDAEMTEHLKNNKPDFGSNWAAGDVMYKDLNGDGVVNAGSFTLENHGDVKIIGNSTPRYNFGLNLDFRYKGFDFSTFFQGTAKRDLDFSGSNYFYGANANMWQVTGYDAHLDYFRANDTKSPFGANTDAYFPRPLFGAGGKNYKSQTRWLQDGSYVRLKNIQMGYTLPSSVLKPIGLKNLRIYVSAENMLTFTNLMEVFDPEAFTGGWGTGKTYPLSKAVSTGLSLTF